MVLELRPGWHVQLVDYPAEHFLWIFGLVAVISAYFLGEFIRPDAL